MNYFVRHTKTIEKMEFKTLSNGNEITLKLIEDSRFSVLNDKLVYDKAIELIDSEAQVIKLDIEKVKFIDSSAFSTLLKLHKHANRNQKQLIMLNASEEALELFKLLKLHEVFSFENTSTSSVNIKDELQSS